MEKDWKSICEELASRGDSVRDWDRGFVESVLGQLNKGYRLSHRQTELLEKVVKRNCPDNLKREHEWRMGWNAEKRNIALICARYYLKAGYYTRLAQNIIDDEKFIPTLKQYQAMCENKYAQKVIAATVSEPIYPVGSVVDFRANAPWQASRYKSGAVVLEVGGKAVTSAAKGAKVYQVLPVGAPKPITLEERHLKKFRQPKKK